MNYAKPERSPLKIMLESNSPLIFSPLGTKIYKVYLLLVSEQPWKSESSWAWQCTSGDQLNPNNRQPTIQAENKTLKASSAYNNYIWHFFYSPKTTLPTLPLAGTRK